MDIPPRLRSVYELLTTGNFRSGLDELRPVYDEKRAIDRVVMAELLLRTGDWRRAKDLAESVLGVRSASLVAQARAHELLAQVARLCDKVAPSIDHWESSLALASRAEALEQICRAQIGLISIKADTNGPECLGSLVTETCWNVTRSGDAQLHLWMHMRFAEIEAKRGAFEQAERHVSRGEELLKKRPNLWIQGRLHLLHGAFFEVVSNLERAIGQTTLALDVARISGSVFDEAAALSNLAHLCIVTNRLDGARRYLEEARPFVSSLPRIASAAFENFAQLELLQGNWDACEHYLSLAETAGKGGRYVTLENGLTKIRLMRHRRQFSEALALAESYADVARDRSAQVLVARFVIAQIDTLLDTDRRDDALARLRELEHSRQSSPLRVIAELERIHGRLAVRSDKKRRARSHTRRALRILRVLGHSSRQAEICREVEAELQETLTDLDDYASYSNQEMAGTSQGWSSLYAAARVLEFGNNPILLGEEVLVTLAQSSSPLRAVLLAASGDRRTVIRHLNWPDFGLDKKSETDSIALGIADGVAYELQVDDQTGRGVLDVLDAVKTLVDAALHSHEARKQRAQRPPLWPLDIVASDGGPVFQSVRMQELRAKARQLGRTELPVLITGETGVGKEVIAKEIHAASRRASRPFQAINCASIPKELFEGHLFGHQKGTFTGATHDSLGVIRANDGGTIFLDEIGELSLEMQVKLLRVLDAREVHPLGSPKAIPVDIRIIAATNANIEQLIQEKRFRSDLFYRLNGGSLKVPPLRERREEITHFVLNFLTQFCEQNERPLLKVSDEALECLRLYDWPGNIRELKNEMERLAGLVDGPVVRPEDLKSQIVTGSGTGLVSVVPGTSQAIVSLQGKIADTILELTRLMVVDALQTFKGHLGRASKRLGLTRKGLYNKRNRFNLADDGSPKVKALSNS